MNINHTTRLLMAVSAIAFIGFHRLASADAFPTKPITIIVPGSAGGGGDIVARGLAKEMADILGQPVVIENRAGAGGNVGNVATARAKPDGYTLVVNSNGFLINPWLYSNAGYDAKNDFTPVGRIATGTVVLAVNNDHPAKNLQEFIQLAKEAKPARLYGSPGNGTVNHLATVMFLKAAGIDMEHVAYNGAPATMTAVLGNQVDMAFLAPASSGAFIQSGKLRGLGITTDIRLANFPDIPPIKDTVPGYNVTPWYGVFAPKDTPAPVVAKLSEAINTAIQRPALKDSLATLAITATPISQKEFASQVHAEVERWEKVVKETNAKVE